MQLGTAFDLQLPDAAVILKQVAVAVREAVPANGRLVQMQDELLEFVERISAGDEEAVNRVTSRLRYEQNLASHYVRIVVLGWLEQARLDARKGLSGRSSLWVEVDRARFPKDALPLVEAMRHSFEPVTDFYSSVVPLEDQPAFVSPPARSVEPPPSPSAAPPAAAPSRSWFPRILRRARPANRAAADAMPRHDTLASPPPLAPRLGRVRDPGRIVINDPGASEPPTPTPPKQANEYRVWFGTNRKLVAGDFDPSFSGERSKIITHGYCDVYVPKSHKVGSLGSSFLERLVTWTDNRLKLRRACPVPDEAFWLLLKYQLESIPSDRRHAVVFIHGYNVNFTAAALRTAQLGFDLGIEGAMAFFSWPSKGSFEDYKADEASIEASEPAITAFLVNFAERVGATAVHVIAHSMGNRGVLRAVGNIAKSAQERTGVPFANFILAAPDVDADTFMNLSDAYGHIARRTTLYVSERDRAVGLSAWLHEYPRAGYAPPVTVCAGIDTISVANIDLTVLGHGYVGDAREVLSDMHALIFQEAAPDERFSLRPTATAAGQRYWVVGA